MHLPFICLSLWLTMPFIATAQQKETRTTSRTVVTTTTTPAAYKDRDAITALLKRRMTLIHEGQLDALPETTTADAEIRIGSQPRQSLLALINTHRAQAGRLVLSNHQVKRLNLENRNATATETFDYVYTPAGRARETGAGTISNSLIKGDDGRWRITRSQVTHSRN
ncbi:hypothetical protein GCM10023189_50280 [Nibrella saemangeumensis]|uniref:SnoaL-like domain-containing protein n=1 Tax=Nibrella saemangeumensis TaxID=1084526 RepID=A0ABP8NH31_9BACT